MNILKAIRSGKTNTVVVGNHQSIIQSMLDFDFLIHRKEPSVKAVLTTGRTALKFFYGSGEVLLPCFRSYAEMRHHVPEIHWMLNVQSGRRALDTTLDFFHAFPNALGGIIFAENVPERNEIQLFNTFRGKKFILGPASVGLLVPGALKLGAVAGTDIEQLCAARVGTRGRVAVISTSGGMTNEFIRSVVHAGKRISFAAAVGGERFAASSLADVFLLAEEDPHTEAVVYFGELGGTDEYELVTLIQQKRFTKKVLAHIAGSADQFFNDRMQFGHAKALARSPDESANAKKEALKSAGVHVFDSYSDFLNALPTLPGAPIRDTVMETNVFMHRQKSILSTRTVGDPDTIENFVTGRKLTKTRTPFTKAILAALMDRDIQSATTVAFTEAVFDLLIDHGGAVSGAVNTMITARAGRDMATSLATGLLTVGPRFGGAMNAAADVFRSAVSSKKSATALVAEMNTAGVLIPGIGHKKYRVGLDDPRVKKLSAFATLLKKHPHYDFARAIEKVTTAKNGLLILNVDGAIAALFLDILSECEKLPSRELDTLIRAEFFNAFFIIPRSVGFIAHYMEQKMHDEGLFRLPDALLFVRKSGGKKQSRR